jgi:uncharacterized membrane protein
MNIPDLLLPHALLWPANLVAALLLVLCLVRAPWRRLDSGLQHLWLASCVILLLVWSIKAGIKPGLNFHLLGATLLTLMFGPCLAIVALSAVLLGVTLAGASGWTSLGVNFLLMIALPVLFSYAVYCQAHHKLPRHVFVYVFLDAFFSAGIAMALTGTMAILLLAAAGAYTLDFLRNNYLTYFILMGWPEALLTGMSAMLMVAYKPRWLATFSDDLYLYNK